MAEQMVSYQALPGSEIELDFCRQCQADIIGPPEDRRCGTCGLPPVEVKPARKPIQAPRPTVKRK